MRMAEQDKLLSNWVELYTQDLFSWALHRTSNGELAKDLVQDTFMAAVKGISSFKGDSNPKTWLMSILKNKIVDYYRKKDKEKQNQTVSFTEFFDERGSWTPIKSNYDWADDETHLLDDPEFNGILRKCIEALPDKWRTGLLLKYYSTKNSEDICQELEVTTTNYWQIVHRAKLQLRECVDNNWSPN